MAARSFAQSQESRIQTVAARLHLGLLSAEDASTAALELIRSGHDNPALRGAASAHIPPTERLPLLAAGLVQAGAATMTDAEALDHVIRGECLDIHLGSTSPYDGARRLAAFRDRFNTNRILAEFADLVAEWNESLTSRPQVEAQIIKYARVVLAGSGT